MPIPKFVGRGGNRHPVLLGYFIRDVLQSGGPTWGANIYRQYKEAVQAIPYIGLRGKALKSGKKRKPGSYNYFTHYLHVCEELGLIRRIDGMTQPAVQHTAGGYDPSAPELQVNNFQDAQFWEVVPGSLGASEWSDPWGSLYPSSRIRLK
ncbi:MAG: hypothetical protein PHC43_00280 [Candidatus Marinimicrobia bacterium]|jgi:hypothetical protein|nr:hypothetical protein [Candidatus Neomarinimicrobiota bacterium]